MAHNKPGTPQRVNTLNLLMQSMEAFDAMRAHVHYAVTIGCAVDGDAIYCNAAQAALLAKWWQTRTESRELAKFGMRVT